MTTGSRRTEIINTHFLWIDFHIKFFGLRKNHHSCRAGVYAPLGFSLRYPLYTVYTGLKTKCSAVAVIREQMDAGSEKARDVTDAEAEGAMEQVVMDETAEQSEEAEVPP